MSKKVAWIDPACETSAVFEVISDNDDSIFLKNEFSEVEALPHEIQSLEDTYCCSICGSIDIQEQGWFYINKKGPVEITDMVEGGTIWCPTCDGYVSESVTCDEYEKSRH